MKSPTGASLYGCVPSANNAVTTPVQPEVECAAVHAVHVHAREDPMCPDTRSCRMASRRIIVVARNLTSPPDMQKKYPESLHVASGLPIPNGRPRTRSTEGSGLNDSTYDTKSLVWAMQIHGGIRRRHAYL